MWQQWINGILGLWVIIMPFIGGADTKTVVVVTGVVIAILGFWGAFQKGA